MYYQEEIQYDDLRIRIHHLLVSQCDFASSNNAHARFVLPTYIAYFEFAISDEQMSAHDLSVQTL